MTETRRDNWKKHWAMKNSRQKAFMVGGALSLGLAIIGLFLPIVPQVPFAILAAFFFSKGSPELHQWLRKHPHMGPPIVDWEDHQVVRPKLKMISTLAMLTGAALGHWKLPPMWAFALDAIFLASIAFLLSRKSSPQNQSPQY